jgi:hypothetical protein
MGTGIATTGSAIAAADRELDREELDRLAVELDDSDARDLVLALGKRRLQSKRHRETAVRLPPSITISSHSPRPSYYGGAPQTAASLGR